MQQTVSWIKNNVWTVFQTISKITRRQRIEPKNGFDGKLDSIILYLIYATHHVIEKG
jgi:hypothetical protein